jgi:hypothetical protein
LLAYASPEAALAVAFSYKKGGGIMPPKVEKNITVECPFCTAKIGVTIIDEKKVFLRGRIKEKCKVKKQGIDKFPG